MIGNHSIISIACLPQRELHTPPAAAAAYCRRQSASDALVRTTIKGDLPADRPEEPAGAGLHQGGTFYQKPMADFGHDFTETRLWTPAADRRIPILGSLYLLTHGHYLDPADRAIEGFLFRALEQASHWEPCRTQSTGQSLCKLLASACYTSSDPWQRHRKVAAPSRSASVDRAPIECRSVEPIRFDSPWVRIAVRTITAVCQRDGDYASMAERAGFEPAVRYERTHTFQACSFSRSDTSPGGKTECCRQARGRGRQGGKITPSSARGKSQCKSRSKSRG